MNDNELDNNELDNEEGTVSGLDAFASSLGGSFGVEVSEEAITGKAKELEETVVDQTYISPNLKNLKEVGEAVIAGVKTKVEMETLVNKIYQELELTVKNFQLTKEVPPENDDIREQIPLIEEALELNKKALDTIKNYFADENSSHINAGIEMAQQATTQLNRAFNVITGSLITAYRKIRESQKERIIDTVIGEDKKEEELKYTTPNVEKLKEASTLVTEGKINDREFKNRVEEVENNIVKNIEVIQEEKKNTKGLNKNEVKVFLQYLDLLESGLNKTMEGIEEIKVYYISKNSLNLDKGLDICSEGAKLLASAYAFKSETDKMIKQGTKEEREKKWDEMSKEKK
jgi:hypothetical protein